MKTLLIISMISALGLSMSLAHRFEEQHQDSSPDFDRFISATTGTPEQDQDPEELQEQLRQQARQTFMRGKLLSNQMIVEGLTTNDFQKIIEGSAGITAMVKGQHWFVIDDPEYRNYSQDMNKIAGKLNQTAAEKNMEAATLRYFEMTLNCIDCHRYIESLNLGR
jgi:hypothetical protein